jgi:hypothetical protein
MWLPAVGAVLFLTVGLFWALSTPPKDPTETMGTPAGSVTAAVVSAAPPTPAPPPPRPPPTPPPLRRVTPPPPGH